LKKEGLPSSTRPCVQSPQNRKQTNHITKQIWNEEVFITISIEEMMRITREYFV
jgi:hypothetical protein